MNNVEIRYEYAPDDMIIIYYDLIIDNRILKFSEIICIKDAIISLNYLFDIFNNTNTDTDDDPYVICICSGNNEETESCMIFCDIYKDNTIKVFYVDINTPKANNVLIPEVVANELINKCLVLRVILLEENPNWEELRDE